jgi:hypothetical protein
MKSMIIAACLAAGFGLATGVRAQTESPNSQKAATGKQQTIAVTGCLKQGTGSEGEFLLAKLPASSTGATTTFRLVGGGKVNLKDHVGHKVEVKGKMHETSAKPPAAASAPDEQKLTVTSLTHLADTCELPIAK